MSPSASAPPSPGSGPAGGDLAAVDRAITALEAQRSVLGDDVVETALAPLRERRAQLVSRERGEQRKLVSVLFADLVDFTVLSRQLDPEDTRTVVGACFAGWQAAIEAHGGVVEKFIGDAVMAVFGLQRSYEDDAERAVRAGLDMTAATAALSDDVERRFGVTPRMRVGIDTGEVVVSTLGGERAGSEFVAVGPTVNRAARLQAAAPVGGVLVSTETYRQVRRAFNVRPVPGLELKGLDAPVDAYAIVSERPRGFRLDQLGVVEGIEASTVGRGGEIRYLQERFLDVVDEGRYLVVDVMGDAGIGKSRLLRDFDLWLAGQPQVVWWFRGRASHVEQNRANSLTRDVIATRMEIAESDPPGVVREKLEAGFAMAYGEGEEAVRAAHVVGTWLGFDLGTDAAAREGVPTEPQSVRDQATVALGQYFARLARSQPVVILLEDLHWADSTSMRLLDDAERMWRDCPVMVVATTRSTLLEDRPRWGSGLDHHVRLTLGVTVPPREPHPRPRAAPEGRPAAGGARRPRRRLGRGQPVLPRGAGHLADRLGRRRPRLPAVADRRRARGPSWSCHRPSRACSRRASTPSPRRNALRCNGLRSSAGSSGMTRSPTSRRSRRLRERHPLRPPARARPRLRARALRVRLGPRVPLQARTTARRGLRQRAARPPQRVPPARGPLARRRHRPHRPRRGVCSDRCGPLRPGPRPDGAAWYLRAGRRSARVFALDEATHLLERAEQRLAPDDTRLLFDVLAEREDVLERQGDRTAQAEILRRMAELSDARRPRPHGHHPAGREPAGVRDQ